MILERPVFKVYVKTGCPYCDKARDFILKEVKTSMHLIDITEQKDLHELIIADTGQKTVPAIFLGSEFIGGCDDLLELHEKGNLEAMILKEENEILKSEIMRLRRSI